MLVLETPGPGQPGSARANAALILACEAWASAFPGKSPDVLPIQLFYTSARDRDILVHIGRKLSLDNQLDGQIDDPTPHSSPTFHQAAGNRVFALDDQIIEDLLGDLERALQTRLREQWQARAAWKQNVGGLRLNSSAATSLCKINEEEPETLVALRDLCESSRETRRQWSLVRLRSMLEGLKLSLLTRSWGWIESVVGLPLALYGLLNHLAAGLALHVCGLTGGRQSSKGETWLARILVVVSSYGGQIALVSAVAGRAAAGYYALTLPTSGLYLFRYRWLLRKRTSVLLLKKRAASLHRLGMVTQKRFFEFLDHLFARRVETPPRHAQVGT